MSIQILSWPIVVTALLSVLVVSSPSSGQPQAAPGGVAPDFLGLSRLGDSTAWRSSSNNPDPASNDDSKRPIPGETVVLADLQGPGVVTHMWVTVAANEYGWPRLLRLRVYYDGSAIPSVDAPLGDFFAVGHGFERPVNSLLIRDSSSGRSRNSYWPMPFRHSCRITITNEGRRRVANLYYHVDWSKATCAAAGDRLLPRALPAGRAGRPGTALRSVVGQGPRPIRRHGIQRHPGRTGLVWRRRRPFLRGRGSVAAHRGDRHGGLFQRRVEPARGGRPACGGARRGWHRRGRPHDRLSLAHGRPDPVRALAAIRLRAHRVDLQQGRLGALGFRGTGGSLQQRGVLVPVRHRARSAAGPLRRRPPASR